MNGLSRKDIENSLQCQWLKQQGKNGLIALGASCALLAVICLVCFFLSGCTATGYFSALLLTAGVLCVVLLPKSACAYFKRDRLIREYAALPLYTATLQQPRTVRHTVSFYVTLLTNQGEVKCKTEPMFYADKYLSPSANEYSGKQVRLLYDELKKRVYVI